MSDFFGGFWGWLKKVPGEVWAALIIVVAALGVGIYIDRSAVRRTKDKQQIDDLEETIILQDTAKEVVNEIETKIEGVDDAIARLPYFASADELRRLDPSLAEIILGDPEGHKR